MLLLFFMGQSFSESFTDSSGSSDNTAVNQSKSFSDSSSPTDTAQASFIFFENPTDTQNTTDNFSVEFSPSFTDSEYLLDTEEYQVSVVLDDGGMNDNTTVSQSKVLEESVGSSDNFTTVLTITRSFTESTNPVDTTSYDRSIVILDNGQFENVIIFGHGPGFGTFVFGRTQGILSDEAMAVREVEFFDNLPSSDTFKTVKKVPAIKLIVDVAELRWLIE